MPTSNSLTSWEVKGSVGSLGGPTGWAISSIIPRAARYPPLIELIFANAGPIASVNEFFVTLGNDYSAGAESWVVFGYFMRTRLVFTHAVA